MLDDVMLGGRRIGTVMLDGPHGVAVAKTSEAARETGRRLIAAAEEAALQLRQ
ncbi:MAG: hypothetical protein M3R64_12905 [Pseudomonadota bacterium]|nr:hypothetical protein [Pseudomonadota bacterium]